MAKRECCEQEKNLKVVKESPWDWKILRQCTVCGAKHYEFGIQPLVLNIKGKSC